MHVLLAASTRRGARRGLGREAGWGGMGRSLLTPGTIIINSLASMGLCEESEDTRLFFLQDFELVGGGHEQR